MPADRQTAPETGAARTARGKEKWTADTQTVPVLESAGAAKSPRPPQTPCSIDWCNRSHRLCASAAKRHMPATAAPPKPEERAPNRFRSEERRVGKECR